MKYSSKKLHKMIDELNKDNRGSSLLAVLISSGIVLLLALTILFASYTNFQMKIVQQQSNKNFYDAESAMNEIIQGLQSDSQEALSEAIAYTETYYASTPASERSKYLDKIFTDSFVEVLIKKAYGAAKPIATDNGSGKYTINLTGSVENDFCRKLEKMTSGSKVGSITVKAAENRGMAITYDLMESYVKLQGISVKCTDRSGYETTILTDLRFEAPDGLYDETDAPNLDVFEKYSIIADGIVTSEGKQVRIDGNIYGGKGIRSNTGAEIFIAGEKIISKADLLTVDDGSISVSGKRGNPAQIWVKNIKTELSDGRKAVASQSIAEHLGKAMKLSADCYVADDLIIGAPGYDVYVDGSYYGYHTGNVPYMGTSGTGEEEPNDGSSVSVNAPHANLDIASGEGQQLLLSGTGKLKLPLPSGGFAFIPFGESMTYRWTQDAYMIQGDMLNNSEGEAASGRNPMPESEFEYLTDGGSKPLVLDYDKYKYKNDVNLSKYLNPAKPYIAQHVQVYKGKSGAATDRLVYFYMNFIDSNSASNYFSKYFSIQEQRDKMTNLADVFGYGSIKAAAVNNSKAAGNLLMFKNLRKENTANTKHDPSAAIDPFRSFFANKNTTDSTASNAYTDVLNSGDRGTLTLTEKNRNVFSGDLVSTENELTYRFNGLLSALDETRYTSYPRYDLANNLMMQNNFSESNIIYGMSGNKLVGKALPVKGKGDFKQVEITSNLNGLVVADCDVVISPGCTFNGCIVTTGTVRLGAGANITAGVDKRILNKLTEKENIEPEHGMINISFENWKKN